MPLSLSSVRGRNFAKGRGGPGASFFSPGLAASYAQETTRTQARASRFVAILHYVPNVLCLRASCAPWRPLGRSAARTWEVAQEEVGCVGWTILVDYFGQPCPGHGARQRIRKRPTKHVFKQFQITHSQTPLKRSIKRVVRVILTEGPCPPSLCSSTADVQKTKFHLI